MASASNFVLKAYKTEANARADSNSLAVDSISAATGSTIDNPSQAAGYGYWAFQRYWYRIEANEPVSEFYIDWDDGEDNSPKKANVSIIKADKPSFVGIVSHIYTQSKRFYPLIRVKSTEGFLSKWYTSYSTSNDFDGLDDDIKTDGNDKGQNSFSIVSMEKNNGSTAFARIPVLKPANVPPVGILKADRKRIFSSIDNDWLGNNARLLNGLTAYGEMPSSSTITAQCSNAVRMLSQVKVTYQEGISGGVSQVFSFRQAIKGSHGENACTANDFEDKAILITTMDETYLLWVNLNGAQDNITDILGATPETGVPIIVVPEYSTSTGTDFTTMDQLKDATLTALNAVVYPAPSDSGSRTEFTATAAQNSGDKWDITVTNNIKGPMFNPIMFGTATSTDIPWEGGNQVAYGTGGILVSTQGAEASSGDVRQKTLTCDGSGVTNKIERVAKVLRVELVNNIEATDGYGGVVDAEKLYPGERIYLQAGISTSTAATATFTFDTTATLNSEIELIDSDDVTRTYQFKDNVTSGTLDGATRVLVDRGDNANDSADQLEIAIEHANGHNGTIKVDVINTHTHTHDTHHVQTGKVTLTQSKIGTDGNTAITLDAIAPVDFTDATSINPPAAFGGGAGAIDTALPNTAMRTGNLNLNSTVCSVSTGNPIIDLRSTASAIMVDATESKVRCSNNSIDSYYFDDNKLISGDSTVHSSGDFSRQNHQMADTTVATWGITDKIIDGADSKSLTGTKELRYTHEWYRDHQDANYRYYPIRRLVRTQIEDTHTQVAEDSFSRSPIVHWDYTGYLSASAAANSTTGQPSDISNWNYGALLYTNTAQLRSPNWYDLKAENRGDMYPLFQCYAGASTADNLTYVLEPSTSFGATGYTPSNMGDATGLTDTTTAGPRNALFMARKEKFDRIFVRVSHDRLSAAGLTIANIANDITPGTTIGWPKIRIQVLYPAKKTSALNTIVWKTLPILDRTKISEKDDSSFYLSGDISFIPPQDWIKTSHSNDIEYPLEDNFFEDGSGTTGLNDVWNKDSYALLFLITNIAQGVEAIKPVFNIMSVYPYNNAHSQLIEIVDPMHISLNSYAVAQSVAFTRKGKYQEIKDRSGISLMRRVGAEGGNIKLGSLDLKSDPNATRAKFYEFQNHASPVYYDLIHKDDTITRLFGVMTSMSEDFPTGKIIPKFACTMNVTHTLELDSSGNITGKGYKPMGGDVVDVEQYLSTG